MKQKLRAATNDIIDSLESYFIDKFTVKKHLDASAKNDQDVSVLDFQKQDVNIVPPMEVKKELKKFDDIKSEINKSIESHIN